jgi:hypothetical protein
MQSLALTLLLQGKDDEAEHLPREVQQLPNELLSREHPMRLAGMNNISILFAD